MSLIVRVVAPTGRDGELITVVLGQNGVPAQTSQPSALPLEDAEQNPMGPLLLAEEALSPALIDRLGHLVRTQPPWSDLPIMILTGGGRETMHTHRLQREWLPLGAPILLERPIRTGTLVSSVQAALRARKRQYEIRDALVSLRAERELLQVMFDNLPVGVVLAKASGEMIRGNRRLESIFRHTLHSTPETGLHGDWIAYHADGSRVQRAEFPLPRAMASRHAMPPEDFLCERGDGTKAWVRLAAAPILDDRGTVTGGVVTVADVDQEKRSEMALIQSEKLAAVGRLAASISHEINNPLEAVTNLLYIARQEEGLSPEVRGYLDAADEELSRVSQIVTHTLRFHRQSTRPRALSAGELLEPTVGLYSARFLNLHIGTRVEQRGTAQVTCFEGEIRQVLNNLIGNAIESMKTGGRLRIRTTDARFWKTGNLAVRITIADGGTGMAPGVLNRIFDAFYTTKGENGTGLGLWISRGIVEKHHGLLQVFSSTRPGSSGTTFSLLLPLNPFEGHQGTL